jgi:hypothetical protein
MILRWPLLLAAALVLLATNAQAHNLSVAHVDIRPAEGGGQRVELDLALRDLALSLPLDADRDELVTWGELQAARAPIESMLRDKLHLADGAGDCPLRVEALGVRRYDDGAYAALVLDAGCTRAAGLRLDYELFFDTDPRHRALVTVHRAGGVGTAIAHAGARSLALPAVSGHPFGDFVREGIAHILSGYDHLAFLLSLLLPAPLVLVAGAWQPARDWRRVLWPTLGLVTAFTAAHSITLSLAALGWVRPSSFWVEAAIAASVVVAALNNLRPLVTRWLWAVGFGFGLVHGLGFAGALMETGLPADARLSALFGLKLGVELGQLGVVSLALPTLYLLRNARGYPDYVLRLCSLGIAALAGWWLLERLAG